MPLKAHKCIGYFAIPVDTNISGVDLGFAGDISPTRYEAVEATILNNDTSPNFVPEFNDPLAVEWPKNVSLNSSASTASGIAYTFSYSFVFILATIGNSLVITTLLVNKQMSTVTNYFLLSLSVSDLLVAIVCIPIDLVGRIIKRFIFGDSMCKLIHYLMGISVSVSILTMLAISLERYYAICCPLRARAWQTKSHACKVICGIWTICFIIMSPLAIYSETAVIPIARKGICVDVCRMTLPNDSSKKTWYLFNLIALLVLPGILMTAAYGMVCRTIYQGFRFQVETQIQERDIEQPSRMRSENQFMVTNALHASACDGAMTGRTISHSSCKQKTQTKPLKNLLTLYKMKKTNRNRTGGGDESSRVNQTRKQLEAKKKVVEMLIVIVFFFFICTTPTILANVWRAFDAKGARLKLDKVIGIIHLMSYVSTCINPIVYCFLNKKFRRAFLNICCLCCTCMPEKWKPVSKQGKTPQNGPRTTMTTAYASTAFSHYVKE